MEPQTNQPSTPMPQTGDIKNTILIVDDVPENLVILGQQLGHFQYPEALAILEQAARAMPAKH